VVSSVVEDATVVVASVTGSSPKEFVEDRPRDIAGDGRVVGADAPGLVSVSLPALVSLVSLVSLGSADSDVVVVGVTGAQLPMRSSSGIRLHHDGTPPPLPPVLGAVAGPAADVVLGGNCVGGVDTITVKEGSAGRSA